MKKTEAQLRADKKWKAEKIDSILLRVPKGTKEQLVERASEKNETVNGLINRLIKEELSKK